MQSKELVDLAKIYRRVFNTEEGKTVLEDLKKRCFADISTFHPDSRTHAFQEGNRALYLTIQSMLVMDIKRIEENASSEEG